MRRDEWESLKTGMYVVGKSGVKRKILKWSSRSLTIVLKKIHHTGKRGKTTVYCVCDKNFFEIYRKKKRNCLAFSIISDIIEKGRNKAKIIIKNKMKGQRIKWTKAKIKFVIANWEKLSNCDLGKRIGVSEATIDTLAGRLRKAGIILTEKKVFQKFDLTSLIAEVANEMGTNKKLVPLEKGSKVVIRDENNK
jgi:hypothetical protein